MRDDIGEEIDKGLIDLVERQRDTLLSVADVARNALDETADFEGRGKVLDAHGKISDALARIRRELACEQAETHLDAYFTPVGLLPELPPARAPRSCFDALEDKYGLRLNCFKTCLRKHFVGVCQAKIGSPHHNAHLYEADATRDGRIEFKRDGNPLATVYLDTHRTHVNKIVCHVLGDIIGENVRRRRLRKKNRAAKRTAEGLK